MIQFFLACVPPTASHHRKKIIRIRKRTGGSVLKLGDKQNLVDAKRQIDALLLAHRLPRPVRGAVSLTLEFTWPWRTADPKRVRALGRVPRSTRPDCSNLAKTTEDRLVALRFIEDDGQVVELIVRKYFGDTPGIRVAIEPRDQEAGS